MAGTIVKLKLLN